ncbi:contact-dependent growth inhibition system immunity protein [Streptomyces sp. NPDC052012]|uniref:contact-dependent growth inhibition system immunity protein n=1 Tax=Streptomyces sp. NPDC052012 TaxID=3155051 RepID=UPI00344FD588
MTEAGPPAQRFHEIHHVLSAYASSGFTYSDAADVPGPGLAPYLRLVARDPARGATAVQQIDELLAIGLSAEGIADEVNALPRIQPPAGMTVEDCLRIARDQIHRALQDRRLKPRSPQEWEERFPILDQLLGAYFCQDFPCWYATWQEAIDDYVGDMSGEEAGDAAEEITELLALVDSDQELKQATHILGLELLPPRGMTLRRWLEGMRQRIISKT